MLTARLYTKDVNGVRQEHGTVTCNSRHDIKNTEEYKKLNKQYESDSNIESIGFEYKLTPIQIAQELGINIQAL